MRFRPILLAMILLLYSCQPLAEESLFVGLPRSASEEVMSLVDGTGEETRFEAIRQLETDSKGNLYVYDLGAENMRNKESDEASVSATIRRITPEGNVTTLIGRGIGRDLTEFSNFVIRDDILYTASAGCLLKADLRQSIIEFEAFYGECLSLVDLKALIQKAEGRSTSLNEIFGYVTFARIKPENEIYFLASDVLLSRALDFKITLEDKVIDITQSDLKISPYDVRHIMDSKGWVYEIVVPDASPFPNKSSFLQRTRFTRASTGIANSEFIHEDQLEAPTTPVLDSADYLYVFDRSLVKMIKPDGSIQSIASIFKNLEDNEKRGITGAVVNPQRTFLYFATATAIYRIPLPSSQESH